MLCNIRKKKVAVLLMGPNEWLLYWFLFEGLILNDFLISPGLPPLPWFGVRSPCSYSKVFAYAALPPPLVKAGGITDDWKVNGRMKWGGLRVCLTGNWVLGGNERLLLRPPSEWRRERFCLKQIWLKGEEAKVLPNNGCGLYEGFPEWQGKSLSTTGNEEWTMANQSTPSHHSWACWNESTTHFSNSTSSCIWSGWSSKSTTCRDIGGCLSPSSRESPSISDCFGTRDKGSKAYSRLKPLT